MPAPDDLAYFSLLLQRLAPGVGPLGELELIDTGYGATTLRSASGIAIRIPNTERLAFRQQTLASPMRRLAPLLPIPIPVPLWTLPMGYPFELGATGYAWIPGEPLTPERTSQGIAGQLGAFLAAMHAIHHDTLASFTGTFPDRATVDAERERVMKVALPWLRETHTPAVMERLERWWDRNQRARERARYTPRLVHGDLWHGNLLVAPERDRLTGVIDWENVSIDDPAQDFATLMHSGGTFTELVMRAYEHAGGTIDDDFLDRCLLHWEYREFTGVALAVESDDEEEAWDAARKLREGALGACFEDRP